MDAMIRHLTVVTRQGQITLPAEYRRVLNLREGDKVAVSLKEGEMVVEPYGSVTARTAGLLLGDGPAPSAEELRGAVEQVIADAAVVRLGA